MQNGRESGRFWRSSRTLSRSFRSAWCWRRAQDGGRPERDEAARRRHPRGLSDRQGLQLPHIAPEPPCAARPDDLSRHRTVENLPDLAALDQTAGPRLLPCIAAQIRSPPPPPPGWNDVTALRQGGNGGMCSLRRRFVSGPGTRRSPASGHPLMRKDSCRVSIVVPPSLSPDSPPAGRFGECSGAVLRGGRGVRRPLSDARLARIPQQHREHRRHDRPGNPPRGELAPAPNERRDADRASRPWRRGVRAVAIRPATVAELNDATARRRLRRCIETRLPALIAASLTLAAVYELGRVIGGSDLGLCAPRRREPTCSSSTPANSPRPTPISPFGPPCANVFLAARSCAANGGSAAWAPARRSAWR